MEFRDVTWSSTVSIECGTQWAKDPQGLWDSMTSYTLGQSVIDGGGLYVWNHASPSGDFGFPEPPGSQWLLVVAENDCYYYTEGTSKVSFNLDAPPIMADGDFIFAFFSFFIDGRWQLPDFVSAVCHVETHGAYGTFCKFVDGGDIGATTIGFTVPNPADNAGVPVIGGVARYAMLTEPDSYSNVTLNGHGGTVFEDPNNVLHASTDPMTFGVKGKAFGFLGEDDAPAYGVGPTIGGSWVNRGSHYFTPEDATLTLLDIAFPATGVVPEETFDLGKPPNGFDAYAIYGSVALLNTEDIHIPHVGSNPGPELRNRKVTARELPYQLNTTMLGGD